jgi:hypothetical protein
MFREKQCQKNGIQGVARADHGLFAGSWVLELRLGPELGQGHWALLSFASYDTSPMSEGLIHPCLVIPPGLKGKELP